MGSELRNKIPFLLIPVSKNEDPQTCTCFLYSVSLLGFVFVEIIVINSYWSLSQPPPGSAFPMEVPKQEEEFDAA